MSPIRLRDVTFRPNGTTVIDGITLDLPGDGISIVLGPNGAGKSVTLRLLAGLLAPSSGRVERGSAGDAPQSVAMVFQHPMMLRTSVLANAALALIPLPLPAAEKRRRALEALRRVGLADRADASARLLSGGERQRLALARAWAVQPRLLLLDEPTASLDPGATEAVESIIRSIRSDGAKVVMTTHNLGQATRLADDIVFLAGGRLAEFAPAQRFFARPQSAQARAFIQGELPWRVAFTD